MHRALPFPPEQLVLSYEHDTKRVLGPGSDMLKMIGYDYVGQLM